jgi:hypothetical protein
MPARTGQMCRPTPLLSKGYLLSSLRRSRACALAIVELASPLARFVQVPARRTLWRLGPTRYAPPSRAHGFVFRVLGKFAFNLETRCFLKSGDLCRCRPIAITKLNRLLVYPIKQDVECQDFLSSVFCNNCAVSGVSSV